MPAGNVLNFRRFDATPDYEMKNEYMCDRDGDRGLRE